MARRFGATWWGRAWIDALENRARLDPNRLPRGRTYARHDRVSNLTVTPGEVTAFVRGNRPGRYRVLVRVRTYADEEWARVIAAIASRAGHAAALLEGDLDPAIVDDATRAGVELLPGPGDVQPRCSCPDWADPCKHAAAVCYLVADVLDDDPFALFALRGRPREALLGELRAHRRSVADPATGSDEAATASDEAADVDVDLDEGTRASEAWAAWRTTAGADPDGRRTMGDDEEAAGGRGLGSPPVVVPVRPGPPATWPTDPPEGAGFTAEGLRALAADAAGRAWAQLRGEGDAGLDLPVEADVARRAAAVLGHSAELAALARTIGQAPADLVRRAVAWQHGGVAALAALDAEPWRPPVAEMALARSAVVSVVGPRARVVASANRLTAGGVQLRLDRAGRWWRFEKRRGRWEVVAPPAEAPDDLVDASDHET